MAKRLRYYHGRAARALIWKAALGRPYKEARSLKPGDDRGVIALMVKAAVLSLTDILVA
jgi:hypothetical protein